MHNDNNNDNKESIVSTVRIILATIIIASIMIGVYFHIIKKGNDSRYHDDEDIVEFEVDTETDSDDEEADRVEISEDISEVDVDLDMGKVEITAGDEPGVYYSLPKSMTPRVSIEDGKLSVSREGNVKFSLKDIDRNEYRVSIVLPENTELSKLSVEVDFGDIDIEGINADTVDVSADCGDIELSTLDSKSINIDEDLGDVGLSKITADALNIKQSAGEVGCDDVVIKKVSAASDLGDICLDGDFDKITAKCSMGSIEVESKKDESQMELELSVDVGSVKVNGKDR